MAIIISEEQLRLAIRRKIAGVLSEASPSISAGAVHDLPSIADEISEKMHKREIDRLEKLGESPRALAALKAGEKVVNVKPRQARADNASLFLGGDPDDPRIKKPMHLFISSVRDAPITIHVVKKPGGNRQTLVDYGKMPADSLGGRRSGRDPIPGRRLSLFESENELRSFIDDCLKMHGLRVDEIEQEDAPVGAKTSSYSIAGYRLTLAPI